MIGIDDDTLSLLEIPSRRRSKQLLAVTSSSCEGDDIRPRHVALDSLASHVES